MQTYAVFSVLWTGVQIVLLSSCGVSAGEWNESYFIRQVLLKDYDPVVRPVSNSSHPVYVSLSIGIKSFIELDMKKQTLVSFGWLTATWRDSFLTWDVGRHPVEEVHLTSAMVWRPELVVFNTISKLDQFENQKIKLIVRNDGQITWYPGGLFQTSCSIDISHYPLDTQTCSIDIIPWSSDQSTLNGTFNDPAFEISNIDSHPEWTLIRTETEYHLRPSNFWVMRFKFILKRKVMFFVMNMMSPIVLLSLLNCLVFLLPVDSGEKMTVSVTVFLSFAVFMSLINDSLPQNSDSLCLFSAYVAVQMFLSVCSIVMAAVIVFVFDKDREASSSDPSRPHRRPSASTDGKASCELAASCFHPQSGLSPSSTLSSQCPPPADPTGASSEAPCLKGARGPAGAGGGARRVPQCPPPADPTGASSEAPCLKGARGPAGAGGGARRVPQRSLSPQLAWRLVSTASPLTPHERRLLSRALDKTCFLLTVTVNLLSCLTFVLLMVVS